MDRRGFFCGTPDFGEAAGQVGGRAKWYTERMQTVFFTGKGDGGESVVGKKKIGKDDAVLGFLGSLDELNSIVGWSGISVGDAGGEVSSSSVLRRIQEALFILQAEIAGTLFGNPAAKTIGPEHTAYLENVIKEIDKEVPPITKFIVPGGCESAARIDIARAVSRRVERDAVVMMKNFEVSPEVMAFLNRLSSALFALARYENHKKGIPEAHPTYE